MLRWSDCHGFEGLSACNTAQVREVTALVEQLSDRCRLVDAWEKSGQHDALAQGTRRLEDLSRRGEAAQVGSPMPSAAARLPVPLQALTPPRVGAQAEASALEQRMRGLEEDTTGHDELVRDINACMQYRATRERAQQVAAQVGALRRKPTDDPPSSPAPAPRGGKACQRPRSPARAWHHGGSGPPRVQEGWTAGGL